MDPRSGFDSVASSILLSDCVTDLRTTEESGRSWSGRAADMRASLEKPIDVYGVGSFSFAGYNNKSFFRVVVEE